MTYEITDKPPISPAVVEAVLLLHTELMKRMTSKTASETWDVYCLDNLVSKIIDHLTRLEGHIATTDPAHF